jgi:hypothetical protein
LGQLGGLGISLLVAPSLKTHTANQRQDEGANPHRLVFVADPQLVDPHTYPGRPWPLNPLTVSYTDRYMRRAYSGIQKALYPDSVVFLGDLFDGGREWSTRTTSSPDKQYNKYGDSFWQKEYRRFGDIFFKHWGDAGLDPRPGQPGRKIISSLPGNHDLGFARGVQVGVRNRFNAYFGDGNRVDILGNHTFVSIDSVSLSALGQPSPQQVEELWRPTVDFLENAKQQKRRLIQRELRVQQGLKPYPGFQHREIESADLARATLPHANDDVTEFPTILLTHVPLYRAPGTPCGPLREHWPPTPPPKGQTTPLDRDDRNAISVSGGYQYQNVLNREITTDIANKLGDIAYAFSGDDHDYCELTHRSYASAGAGIREITVKSISLAMGVRLPGVVQLSLWNPVDAHGAPLNKGVPTLQSHLCLLPDQLGIFLRYAALFALTLCLLAARAAAIACGVGPHSHPHPQRLDPLLPTTVTPPNALDKDAGAHAHRHSSGFTLQPRGAHARGYALPAAASAYRDGEDDGGEDKVKMWGRGGGGAGKGATRERKKGVWLFLHEMKESLQTVLSCGLVWYFWLLWRG